MLVKILVVVLVALIKTGRVNKLANPVIDSNDSTLQIFNQQ